MKQWQGALVGSADVLETAWSPPPLSPSAGLWIPLTRHPEGCAEGEGHSRQEVGPHNGPIPCLKMNPGGAWGLPYTVFLEVQKAWEPLFLKPGAGDSR